MKLCRSEYSPWLASGSSGSGSRRQDPGSRKGSVAQGSRVCCKACYVSLKKTNRTHSHKIKQRQKSKNNKETVYHLVEELRLEQPPWRGITCVEINTTSRRYYVRKTPPRRGITCGKPPPRRGITCKKKGQPPRRGITCEKHHLEEVLRVRKNTTSKRYYV